MPGTEREHVVANADTLFQVAPGNSISDGFLVRKDLLKPLQGSEIASRRVLERRVAIFQALLESNLEST